MNLLTPDVSETPENVKFTQVRKARLDALRGAYTQLKSAFELNVSFVPFGVAADGTPFQNMFGLTAEQTIAAMQGDEQATLVAYGKRLLEFIVELNPNDPWFQSAHINKWCEILGVTNPNPPTPPPPMPEPTPAPLPAPLPPPAPPTP